MNRGTVEEAVLLAIAVFFVVAVTFIALAGVLGVDLT